MADTKQTATQREALEYIAKIQAQFPRLQIYQVKPGAGYVIVGKFGVLPKTHINKDHPLAEGLDGCWLFNENKLKLEN